ncbi:hypothetical protein [Ligilactobacillus ruminis]|nr:hypothetical protein [Ligilactobacillus ruminis]
MWGEKMELRILDAIQRLHNPGLDWFMCFITGFGNSECPGCWSRWC